MDSLPARTIHAIGPRSVGSRPINRWALGAALALVSAVALANPASSPSVSVSSQAHASAEWSVPNMGQWDGYGGFDGQRMLSTWKQNGVSPQQAFELINVLVWTQSPVMTANSDVKALVQRQHRATQDVMQITTERNASFFLRNNNMERLVERDLVSQTEAVNSPSGFGKTWDDVDKYWSSLSGAKTAPSSASWEQARAQLRDAVQQAGLEQLKIPLPMWKNPDSLVQLAHEISSANQELQSLTQWSGPVLGLNGRLGLFVGSPTGNAYAYKDTSNSIMMSGAWSDIAHEWSHGLSEVLKSSSPSLSQTLSSPMIHHHGPWKDAHTSHMKQLRAEGDHTTADYLSNPEEMMAYAWGSFVQSQLKEGSILHSKNSKSDMADGLRAPTEQEAAQMSGQWKTALSEIKTGWWESSSSPTPLLSMSSIIAKRVASPAHNSPVASLSKN